MGSNHQIMNSEAQTEKDFGKIFGKTKDLLFGGLIPWAIKVYVF